MSNPVKGKINVFKIAATYIGTIVGAGFASGQEVFQFFSVYGFGGIWGIILSTILFFFFGYMILILGQKLQAESYVKVVRFSNGKILGTVIDIIITVFLFGALAAMIAGAGAIFSEQFNLSPLIGTALMASVTLLTVLTGITGVINAISYVVPILLLSVLFITIYSFVTNPLTSEELRLAVEFNGSSPNWFISAIVYASYNLVIAIAILAPLGAQTTERKTLFWGALLGGLGLGIGVVAINFSILTNIVDASVVEVPMILVAEQISPIIQLAFAVVLFAEVYTTAVGNLFGFVSRLDFINQGYKKWIVISTTVLAFVVSQLGFSTMVEYLYPAVGYGGMLLLVGLLYSWIFKRDQFRN
ncbi:YkvI family membrane protein [Aquibacillus saliphilus]|uniref:YkvI family membrane protein n=1 Tax=Aquibacillus saliphilus TaxID=1909422 RepID=UPI001CF03D1C|nr:hypothetical protein [Aquibacillus saliphilus]